MGCVMQRLALFLTALVALGIAWATLSPPGPEPSSLPLTDKQLHALAFAVLILPITVANLRVALPLAPVALAYGGLIELIQPLVGRSGEWADLFADGIGILAGLALGWILRRAWRGRA